jgi:outer membrane receptor for Fe3+-dicitrate
MKTRLLLSAAVLLAPLCVSRIAIAQSTDSSKAAPDTAHTSSSQLRAFEERRAKGHGYYIDTEELRKNDNRSLSNMLKRVSGIRVVKSGMSEYASANQTMSVGRNGAPGSRNCYVSVYEDGVPLYTGTQQVPDFARMPVRDYVGLEFYRGSANIPADLSYVRPSDCGILLLWTKR